MAGVLVNSGRLDVAPSIRTWLNGLTLKLFVNNWSPGVADVVGDYTEATFGGYASVALSSWGVGAIDGNGNVEWDEVPHTFTATGAGLPETVYGYYVVNGSGTLMFAERDPSPFSLLATGYFYTVTPKFYGGALAPPF